MNNQRFSIEKIKVDQLYEYARSSLRDPRFADVAPISLIRALAQSQNPHADSGDIALVVGYEEDRCVGYHGLLPGYLSVEGGLSKVYWLVTFFMMPACRGKGYGKQLVQEIQKTGVDLVTTGITDAAEMVYTSVGFQILGELVYYRINVEGPREVASGFEQHNGWDGLSEGQRNIQAREVRTIDKLAGNRSGQPALLPAFLRDLEVQNWMLQNPWVVSRNEAESDVENYYFSRVRDRFDFIALEFYPRDGNQPVGHMVLSVSSRKSKTVLKILDVFFQDPGDYTFAAHTGMQYAKTYQAQRLEFPAQLGPFFLKQPLLENLIKKKKRLYLYYPGHADSPLAQNASRIELNYCDGDTAFT
ncbi:MAG: GNAT family N-acetyltransferase [Deltaproteobacteria bacterium]|nr:GNAT family N-acetyltransferase [Deltaproteobacteria bacterium]